MNLAGVIVCVDYADFMAETLPLNLRHFDRLVVVTSPEDLATQRICEFHDVDVVLTDVFQSRWGELHKAKGINAGLEWLGVQEWDGWMLHLDADIVLPPRTRAVLDRADLDRTRLYGADRMRVADHDSWRAHQAQPSMQQDGYHVRLDAFPLMPRFSAWHLNGYAPPGYFQLWHPKVSGVMRYPAEHNGGDKTDILHTAQWPRDKRELLAELAVYHLESEPALQGTNWDGRETARWGAEPSQAQPLRRHRHRPWRHHHHHRHPHPGPYGPGPCEEPGS